MKSSFALLGLATSVQALGSSSSQCTDSSVHHTTMILTKPVTATFTSIPTHVNAAPGQGDGHSSILYTTATQGYTSSNSDTRMTSGIEIPATNTAIKSPSSIAASNEDSSQLSASASDTRLNASGTPSAHTQSTIDSSSSSSSISVSASSTAQWSTQSRYDPPPTMATSIATTSSNSSSPKHSVIAFTGSSSTTTASTGGAITVAFLFTMLLL